LGESGIAQGAVAQKRQPCMTEAAFRFGEPAVSGSKNGNGVSVVPSNFPE
jgi:hypothetical protein